MAKSVVANLATLQTPLMRGTFFSLSLFLSVCVSSVQRAAAEEQHFQLNTNIMLIASLILHASNAEITAQLLSLLCVFDFIRRRLDYQDFCSD